MLRVIAILLVILSAALTGCATLSREECSSGDWHKIGMQDGRDGRTDDRFKQHVKACKLDRSETSRQAYLAGREQGLAEYCTDARGYREGALGQTYNGVCPAALVPGFLKGYQLGQKVLEVEKRLSDVANDLRAAKSPGEKKRLEAEDARLRQVHEKLKAQADALVNATRKKQKKKKG